MNSRTIGAWRMAVIASLLTQLLAASIGIPAAASPKEDASMPCDLQRAACEATTNGFVVRFEADPKPVKAMADQRYRILITRGGKPVEDAAVTLEFSMPGMFMGINRPPVKALGNGRYEATGVLPRCMSGKKTWLAEVSMREPKAAHGATVVYRFEVH